MDQVVAVCSGCDLAIYGAVFPVIALVSVHGSATGHEMSVQERKGEVDGVRLGRAQREAG